MSDFERPPEGFLELLSALRKIEQIEHELHDENHGAAVELADARAQLIEALVECSWGKDE
jgi:hypothetical protein